MAGFFIAYPIRGYSGLKKSLSWGRWFLAGTAMVCSRGESPTHHIKPMSLIDIFIFAVIPWLVRVIVFGIATIHTADAWINQADGAHQVKINKRP